MKELLDEPSQLARNIYNSKIEAWFGALYPNGFTKTTKSCTQALELTALLLDIKPGDEVIMPSFTHVSTANPFVLRGGIPVFIDINPETMNIDETLIEEGISDKTKAIVVMHYGGVGCEMDTIMGIAQKHNIAVIEDNAQGISATYKDAALGSFGDISCVSFDHQKNVTCEQGGAITINDDSLTDRLETIYYLGTNKSAFLRSEVEHYEWTDVGSNYQLSELNSAFLYAQLEDADSINAQRLRNWNLYHNSLLELSNKEHIVLPSIPQHCAHNGHIFHIRSVNSEERNKLIAYLADQGIAATSHFQPLHSSKLGHEIGRFSGADNFTSEESGKILRLPLYYNITSSDITFVAERITAFFS